MRCNTCGADSAVRETRVRGEGFIVARRRVCFNEHSFWTYEIDDSMEKTLMKHALRPERIGGLVSKGLLWDRNQRILQRLRKGEKHMNVAADFHLSDQMISTIARRNGIPSLTSIKRKAA